MSILSYSYFIILKNLQNGKIKAYGFKIEGESEDISEYKDKFEIIHHYYDELDKQIHREQESYIKRTEIPKEYWNIEGVDFDENS